MKVLSVEALKNIKGGAKAQATLPTLPILPTQAQATLPTLPTLP